MELSEFYLRLRKINCLHEIAALLEWDQNVFMPAAGAASRAQQLGLMHTLVHQQLLAPDLVDFVDTFASRSSALSEDDAVNIRETKRQIDRMRKLPDNFIEEKSKAVSASYCAWAASRPKNDFAAVRPSLEKVIELVRWEADLCGYEAHPYDALLDIYEPQARLHEIKPLLLTIADRVRQLFPREDLPVDADASALSGKQFPESRQFDFCRTLLQAIGLPPQSFRLDPTAHPFVRHIGARDIRITSRCQTNNIFAAVFTTLHETGHAIYEFGLPPQHYGTPRGEPASLAIHESQSRLWENFIGRSKPFCSFLFTLLCRDFPAEFANLSADQIWSDVNQVQKSLIRVEADELTYSLHIVIRLLLEEQLVSGTLPVLDLPDAWNALYEHYLRIRPTNNYAGVMQDVHWFQGAVGYFPAYALGNMYAAQLWSALRRENTNIDGQIEQGDFSALIAWLTDNIFVHGKKFTAAELIRRATSKEPSAEDFLQYLEAKFAPQKE